MFLELLLFKVFDNGETSLNDHSVHVGIHHQLQIRKQSIDERFNEHSVEFVRTLLEQQIGNQINNNIDVECLRHFSSVKIKDSTRFQIPAHFKEAYPGCGGGASEAGVHTQFEYDVLSGKVVDLHVTDALHADNTDAIQTTEMIQEGSLILRDLGYFSSEILQKIEEKKAYYISRMKSNMKIYEKKKGCYQEVCLKKIHNQMKRHAIPYKELNVFIGEKKIAVRLLVELMPEQEVNKRLAKAGKVAHKRGKNVTEQYKTMAALNIFVTNVPKEWLPSDQIRTLYRLRWQIEIRFKTWKSFCRLHACKKMKLHRFNTYLYACLLFILITWEISVSLLSIIWKQTSKLISIIKCFKAIIQTTSHLQEALFKAGEKLEIYLEKLYKTGIEQLLLERRKNHLSQEEIMLLKFEIKESIC